MAGPHPTGRVFLCSGHMVDAPDRAAARFPPVKEEAVRARMAAQLDEWGVGAGDTALCGGARGADLIFAEICSGRGARVQVLLPSNTDDFVEESVRLPGSDWERRFHRLIAHAEVRLQTDELGALPAGESPYARNNRWLLEAARAEAGGAGKLFILLVWDELPSGDGPGGTSDLAAAAAGMLQPDHSAIINPTTIQPFPRDVHLARSGGAKRILSLDGGGVRGILTLQYLKRLEKILQDQHRKPGLRLSDYFDLIAGTSTGSIIAAGLALGMYASEIEEKYRRLADSVFRRSWRRWGVFRAKFDATALEKALEELFDDMTMGSPDLLTGLLVVTKRLDTGSQWPVSNNPRATYFHQRPGSTSRANADYKLRKVVRASTAAPHYFGPELIEVNPGIPGNFVDGGVSTANNPAFEALKLVTLGNFGIGWPTGQHRLLIVSCGTGTADPSSMPSRMAGKHALVALTSIMNDCSSLIETVMQWLSDGPTARAIDGDIGDLAGDLLGGQPVITYRRYNVELTPGWIKEQLGREISAKRLRELGEMDRPANMDELTELGRHSAALMVDEHLPAAFKLP